MTRRERRLASRAFVLVVSGTAAVHFTAASGVQEPSATSPSRKVTRPTSPPLDGYHLISTDLNRGPRELDLPDVTRDSTKVQTGTLADGKPVRLSRASSCTITAGLDVAGFKGACRGIGSPWTSICEDTHDPLHPWKHPDLNDGSGRRFILCLAGQRQWQCDDQGSRRGVRRQRWDRVSVRLDQGSNDLNKGAGGDYIYLCYKD